MCVLSNEGVVETTEPSSIPENASEVDIIVEGVAEVDVT